MIEGVLPYVRDAITFAIYTGLRQEEQFSLPWSQIDLARKQITVSAETAKGKRERTVIMLRPAIDVLARMPRHLKSTYVFHHRAATQMGAPRRSESRSRTTESGSATLPADCGARAERGKVRAPRWHVLHRPHGYRLL